MCVGIDAAIALVTPFFFVCGLSDGTMSADNAGLWLLMLVGVLGIPLGAFILRANGRPPVGAFIAAVLAVEFVATKRDAGRNEG